MKDDQIYFYSIKNYFKFKGHQIWDESVVTADGTYNNCPVLTVFVKEEEKEDFKSSGLNWRWDQDNCPKTCMSSSFPQSLKLTFIDLYETFIKTVGIFMIFSLRQQMIDYNASKKMELHVSLSDN